jgi:hypothetical protein
MIMLPYLLNIKMSDNRTLVFCVSTTMPEAVIKVAFVSISALVGILTFAVKLPFVERT